jgi:hypothetical protein
VIALAIILIITVGSSCAATKVVVREVEKVFISNGVVAVVAVDAVGAGAVVSAALDLSMVY